MGMTQKIKNIKMIHFLINISTVLKGSQFQFVFAITAAGVVHVAAKWFLEISEGIVKKTYYRQIF